MTLRDHLEAIKAKRGELTPAGVVDEARNPKHPLHHRFNWDEHENSERWLLYQARQLIKEVEVTYVKADGNKGRIRAFHAVRQDDDGYIFESLEDLQQDPVSREVVLRTMEREWNELYRRYEQFEEFWELVENSRSVSR